MVSLVRPGAELVLRCRRKRHVGAHVGRPTVSARYADICDVGLVNLDVGGGQARGWLPAPITSFHLPPPSRPPPNPPPSVQPSSVGAPCVRPTGGGLVWEKFVWERRGVGVAVDPCRHVGPACRRIADMSAANSGQRASRSTEHVARAPSALRTARSGAVGVDDDLTWHDNLCT